MSLVDRWEALSGAAKRLTVIGGCIAAVFGAITATNAAWPIVGPFAPAHRGYVTEKVGDVQTTTNELLLWKFEDSKNKITADQEGWKIQITKETDPQTKGMIQRRIDQLDNDQRQVDDRIRKLKGQ